MKPAPFSLVRPETLEQAITYLKQSDGMARVMAGGQSLVPMLNLRLAPAEQIIDLSRISELKSTETVGDRVRIGACVTHAEIEDGRVTDPTGGFMAKVASVIAYRAVRNRGTIGGSLALADPSAEWLCLAVTVDALIHAAGQQGERDIPATDYMLGAYFTVLDEDEILTGISVPTFSAGSQFGFHKLCRKEGEFAQSLAMVARDPERNYARVALGATGSAPVILPSTSEIVLGMSAYGDHFERDLRAAIQEDFGTVGYSDDEFERSTQESSVVRAVRKMVSA